VSMIHPPMSDLNSTPDKIILCEIFVKKDIVIRK